MSVAINLRDQMSLLQRNFNPPAPSAARFQGVVDRFDAAEGLTGWCVALNHPQAAVDLELLIDGLAIARVRTGLRRADVCAETGLEGDFGFRFEPEIFDRYAAHREILGAKRVVVRIAASGLELPGAGEHMLLSAIFARREAYADSDGPKATLERLQGLQDAAEAMLQAPYRPSPAADSGCIELIAPGANGVLWFVGWAARESLREFSAAVLDRRKYRAGAMAAAFEREDLDPDSCGFVGALRTDWRPASGREAILRVEGDGHWRALRSLRLARVADALAHLERAAAGEDAAVAQQLLAFARANDDFDAAPAAASRTRLAVDSSALLEGFGLFMKGWIFSPHLQVKRLHLKLGDRLFEAAPRSLAFSPRPDLNSAFPSGRDAVSRAGFCCVFPIEGAAPALGEASLRIVYEDASVSNHSLPDLPIRRIAPDDAGGPFKEFYPHMERQPMFAPYARAYYAQCEALYGCCEIEAPEPAPIQLVFAAPKERHRLYLMFEELRHNLRRCSARGVGVLLIAGKDAANGEIRELFHNLNREYSGPCSLAFVEDPRFALWSLDCALVALGARRFVYVGADAVLDETGWEAIAGLLAAEPRLAFLELADPCESWAAPEASMHAFGWSAEAFLDWRRRHRLPLGKPPAMAQSAVPERRAACGFIDPAPPPSTTIESINHHAGAH